jgi:hypothetical protein
MNLTEFIKDRDEALRSLDKQRILNYYRKYGEARIAEQLEKSDDTVFWAAVHRGRLTLNSFTAEEKAISEQWLKDHGFEVRPL